MPDQKEINAKVVANAALSMSMGRASAAISSFSGWLFAGFGAAAAFLLANLDAVLAQVPSARVRLALILFAWSVAAAIVQRYLAVVAASSAAGAEEGRRVFAETGIAPQAIDLDVFFDELSRPLWQPGRWIVKSMAKRIKAGDLTLGGRFTAKAAQIQAVFAVAQAGLLLAAVFAVVPR